MELKLPLYNALITDESEGICTISLVECPAVEVPFLAFNKVQQFQSIDEEKHCLTGVIMLANSPIYRCNGDYEYYIQYTPEVIAQMSQKMLKDGTFNNVDINHNGKLLSKDAIQLVECYITDDNKKSPFDVPNGSLIGTYKVLDNDLWELCKSNEINGFSLEGMFEVSEQKFNKDLNIKQKFMNVIEKLKDLLVELESEETKVEETVELAEEETVETPTDEPTEETENEPTPTYIDEETFNAFKTDVENKIAEIMETIKAIQDTLAETPETPIEEEPKEEEETEIDKYSMIARAIKKRK